MKKLFTAALCLCVTFVSSSQTQSHNLTLDKSFNCSAENTKAYFFVKNSTNNSVSNIIDLVSNEEHLYRINSALLSSDTKNGLTISTEIPSQFLPQYLSENLGVSYLIEINLNNKIYVIDNNLDGNGDLFFYDYDQNKYLNIYNEERNEYDFYSFFENSMVTRTADGKLLVYNVSGFPEFIKVIEQNSLRSRIPKFPYKLVNKKELEQALYVAGIVRGNEEPELIFNLPGGFSDINEIAFYNSGIEKRFDGLVIQFKDEIKAIYFNPSTGKPEFYTTISNDGNTMIEENYEYLPGGEFKGFSPKKSGNNNQSTNNTLAKEEEPDISGNYSESLAPEIDFYNLSKNPQVRVNGSSGSIGPFNIGDHISKWTPRLTFMSCDYNYNVIQCNYVFNREFSMNNNSLILSFKNNKLCAIYLTLSEDKSITTGSVAYWDSVSMSNFYVSNYGDIVLCKNESGAVFLCTKEIFDGFEDKNVFNGKWSGEEGDFYDAFNCLYIGKQSTSFTCTTQKQISDFQSKLITKPYYIDLLFNTIMDEENEALMESLLKGNYHQESSDYVYDEIEKYYYKIAKKSGNFTSYSKYFPEETSLTIAKNWKPKTITASHINNGPAPEVLFSPCKIYVQNNTGEPIMVALYYYSEQGRWKKAFWYKVENGETARLVTSHSEVFYSYARSLYEQTWDFSTMSFQSTYDKYWGGDDKYVSFEGISKGMIKNVIKQRDEFTITFE